ncbi:MAG: hypothetical protein PHH77_02325 [Victivallaceae bacterium]|nr:hypothetical protein [Victivallaceae bacterium]MDD5697428.1 hypothetical protein [Victivallaceae bacterium]
MPNSSNLLLKQPISQKSKNDFYLDSRGLEVWQILKEISNFYGVTVLAYDELKNKKISCKVEGIDLKSTLNCIAWICGVEWLQKDGIYYVGGNSQQVCVLSSAGVGADLQNVFSKGQVRIINDKVVISGTESEVTKIKDAVETITDRKFCSLHLWGVEILYDKNLELGVEIDKSIEYFLSCENWLKDVDPGVHLAASLTASVQAESSNLETSTVIDSDLGVMSGSQITFNSGEDVDRPVYSVSSEGNRVVSSYNTQHTGIIIKIKGFCASKDWFFDCYIENSVFKSNTEKALNSVQSVVRLSDDNCRVLVCCLNLGTVKNEYTKGIPFLADIPWLGFLFRVTTERDMKKKIYFILELKQSGQVELPTFKQFKLPLIQSANAVSNVLK